MSFLAQINPIAIEIGPLQIAWYGIIIVVGMMLAIWLTIREAEKLHIGEEFVIDVAFWTIPLGIIGARLYYVLFELGYYLQNPGQIFAIWEGGLAIYGGIIAGLLVIIYFSKKRKVDVWLTLDMIAPHLLLAQSIGRWGNFINQEAFGGEVSRAFLESLFLPEFIIEGMFISGAYRHPTFLYESLWTMTGFIIIMLIRHKKDFLIRGETVSLYMIWYGIGRFFIEGMRTDSLYLGPFRVSQLVSAALIIIGIGIIYYRRNQIYPQPPYYSQGLLPEMNMKDKLKDEKIV